jgi:hypothetical protein
MLGSARAPRADDRALAIANSNKGKSHSAAADKSLFGEAPKRARETRVLPR